jgi:hypothetical protein
MRQKKIKTSDQIVRERNFTLLELLDRLLDKGVMVKGEIVLAVADIDLVYLNLGLLLSSVKSIEQAASRGDNGATRQLPWQPPNPRGFLDEPPPQVKKEEGVTASLLPKNYQNENGTQEEMPARALPADNTEELDHHFGPKATIDPKNVEKGLAKLVLTLVDLVRKLMEKQAIRRIESGQLNSEEIEKMGSTFFLIDERMEQLKEAFGLQGEELNLDLGPLGELL